jgi:hypothetical protein
METAGLLVPENLYVGLDLRQYAKSSSALRTRHLAARIEGLCRDLGHPVLLSAGFVATSGLTAQHLGAFSLKGLSDPQQIDAPTVDGGLG